jgi:hypothetical protein
LPTAVHQQEQNDALAKRTAKRHLQAHLQNEIRDQELPTATFAHRNSRKRKVLIKWDDEN